MKGLAESFLIISPIYIFGGFGFLNLFDIRLECQAAYLFLSLIYLCSRSFVPLPPKYFYSAIIFCILVSLGGFYRSGGVVGYLVDGYIAFFLLYIFPQLSNKAFVRVVRHFIFFSCFLNFLVLIAFIIWLDPVQYHLANAAYDSTTGSNPVLAGSLVNFMSFNSQDGFVFMGKILPRAKGFCFEPSSTVPYYFFPSVISLYYYRISNSKLFLYLGTFMLFASTIAISSFIVWIILFVSILAFMFRCAFVVLPKRVIGFLFVILLMPIFILLSNSSLMLGLFRSFTFLPTDLVIRKLTVDEYGASNLLTRQEGIISGLSSIFQNPFGYDFTQLGAGAGLLYFIGAATGFVGILIFLYFMKPMWIHFVYLFKTSSSLFDSYLLSLLFSSLFIVLFVSGYGWTRGVGVFLFLIVGRLLGHFFEATKSKYIAAMH